MRIAPLIVVSMILFSIFSGCTSSSDQSTTSTTLSTLPPGTIRKTLTPRETLTTAAIPTTVADSIPTAAAEAVVTNPDNETDIADQIKPEYAMAAIAGSRSKTVTTTASEILTISTPHYFSTSKAPATSSGSAVCKCSKETYNCPDFPLENGATGQDCYDYCESEGKGDVHGLDRDKDGFACE